MTFEALLAAASDLILLALLAMPKRTFLLRVSAVVLEVWQCMQHQHTHTYARVRHLRNGADLYRREKRSGLTPMQIVKHHSETAWIGDVMQN